jgi:membrane-bound lytic murein transglycosylase D
MPWLPASALTLLSILGATSALAQTPPEPSVPVDVRPAICSVGQLLESVPGAPDAAHAHRFPLPPALTAAYEFWRRVYGEWTSSQAVLHRDRSFTLRTALDGGVELFDGESDFVVKYDNFVERAAALNAGEAEYWRMQRGQRDRLEPAFAFFLRHRAAFDAAFKAEGAPEEASALGFLESMFRPDALSKTGAMGVFQIQPLEAYKLNARVDAAYNELWDAVSAARLAARKLATDRRALAEHVASRGLTADADTLWPLAVLSYNQGVNSLRRAVEELNTTDVVDVIARHRGQQWGFAGRSFYVQFRLFADLTRAARAKACTTEDAFPAKPPVLVLDSFITLSDVSTCLGVEKNQLLLLNPGITEAARQDLVRLGGGLPLRLPERVPAKARWKAKRCAKLKSPQQVALASYRLKPGETLIAAAETVGAPVPALLHANGLTLEQANRLRTGTPLRVPTARFAELQRRAQAQSRKPLAFTLHRVSAGEDLASIAKRYDLQPVELAKWNDGTEPLMEGTTLSIPLYP